MRIFILAIISISVLGCINPPKPKNESFYDFGDGTYWIEIRVTQMFMPKGKEVLEKAWHKKAGELCGHNNYKVKDVRETESSLGVINAYASRRGALVDCNKQSAEKEP